LISTG